MPKVEAARLALIHLHEGLPCDIAGDVQEEADIFQERL